MILANWLISKMLWRCIGMIGMLRGVAVHPDGCTVLYHQYFYD